MDSLLHIRVDRSTSATGRYRGIANTIPGSPTGPPWCSTEERATRAGSCHTRFGAIWAGLGVQSSSDRRAARGPLRLIQVTKNVTEPAQRRRRWAASSGSWAWLKLVVASLSAGYARSRETLK